MLETVCIVDDGGYPLVLERMDGARITGPQIAWNKAFTAAATSARPICSTRRPTARRCRATRPSASSGASRAGSRCSSAAIPIVVDGEVVGGVGLSGGNGEQDTACGVAALQALAELLAPRGHDGDGRRPTSRSSRPCTWHFPHPGASRPARDVRGRRRRIGARRRDAPDVQPAATTARSAACGTCRVKLVEGAVRYEEPMALTPEEASAGYALACQARPASDLRHQRRARRSPACAAAGAARGAVVARHPAACAPTSRT